MNYYLGIDGGGTVSTAVVSDSGGNILCRAAGGTINFYAVGMAAARKNLAEIIEKINNCLGQCVEYSGVCIGNSALDSQADEALTKQFVKDIISCKTAVMHSDVYIALCASRSTESSCLAICGTGSMAIGVDKNGTVITKGGWGHIIGDEGSAYAISVNALRYACILYDQGKPTALTEGAKEYFGVKDFKGIIEKIYTNTEKSYVAGFARVVSELAHTGDFASKSVIVNEAQSFSKTVLSLIKELKTVKLLSLYGGVFKNNSLFTEIFITDIQEIYPQLEIEFLQNPPEEGALKLARELE